MREAATSQPRSGGAAVNSESPTERRAEVASSFFIVAYIAISIPVVGEGVLAQVAGLTTVGLVFAGLVAALAAVALALLLVQTRNGCPGAPGSPAPDER